MGYGDKADGAKGGESNPHGCYPLEPKSSASTNSATFAAYIQGRDCSTDKWRPVPEAEQPKIFRDVDAEGLTKGAKLPYYYFLSLIAFGNFDHDPPRAIGFAGFYPNASGKLARQPGERLCQANGVSNL